MKAELSGSAGFGGFASVGFKGTASLDSKGCAKLKVRAGIGPVQVDAPSLGNPGWKESVPGAPKLFKGEVKDGPLEGLKGDVSAKVVAQRCWSAPF